MGKWFVSGKGEELEFRLKSVNFLSVYLTTKYTVLLYTKFDFPYFI